MGLWQGLVGKYGGQARNFLAELGKALPIQVYGRIGFRYPEEFNRDLWAKQCRRILKNPEILDSLVLKGCHFPIALLWRLRKEDGHLIFGIVFFGGVVFCRMGVFGMWEMGGIFVYTKILWVSTSSSLRIYIFYTDFRCRYYYE